MLASITPLGQRGRGASWGRTVTAYVAASAAGGAAGGTALGAVGSALPGIGSPTSMLIVAAFAVLALAGELSGRLPSVHRQVDESWLVRYRDWVCGAGFGFQLGLGFTTIATSASLYLTWLLELLTGAAGAGAAIGVVFGIARALPLLANRGVVDQHSLLRSHRRWQDASRVVNPATVVVQAVAAVVLVLAVAA